MKNNEMKEVNTKSVYIPSIEASQIWSHNNRGTYLNIEYKVTLPYSLELIKLRSIKGYKEKKTKTGQFESDDIINVKFKYSVDSGDKVLLSLKDRLKVTKKQLVGDFSQYKTKKAKDEKKISLMEKKDYLQTLINKIETDDNNPNWNYKTVADLRRDLYVNGFKLENGKTYKVYKRSTSKSRKGEITFINEKLYSEMISWSRMGIDVSSEETINLAGLTAYQSLLSSSIEKTIQINPENILLIKDQFSTFKSDVNIVSYVNGHLESNPVNNYEITNNLTDGQVLLDKEYFSEGHTYYQLRNHFFKCASFKTDIQQFMQDNVPNDIEYEDWELTDMFGNEITAKDVKMICTPSTLKALKFAWIKGSEKEMYDYWKELIADEGAIFGVCKWDKPSKHGDKIHQLSYQMFNSLNMDKDDVHQITEWERQYIKSLKDDDAAFIDYIRKESNAINSNEMFAELAEWNPDFTHTEIFRKFRSREVHNYVEKVRSGKVHLEGDYCTILMNPDLMLWAAIGKLKEMKDKSELKGWQVHTKLFDYGDELVGFRSPHNSPANTMVLNNVDSDFYNKYFDLSKNILVINGTDVPIQDKANGCDMDGDTFAVFKNDDTLLKLAKDAQRYRVPVLNVVSKPNEYKLTNVDMATVDTALAKSQRLIGQVTNSAQLLLSVYWNGNKDKKLMDKIDRLVSLSTVAIDLAKKNVDIKIESEINHCLNGLKYKQTKVKGEKGESIKVDAIPLFFKYVKSDEKKKYHHTKYDTPMDLLIKEMDNLPPAKGKSNIEFGDLVIEMDDLPLTEGDKKREADRKQEKNIIDAVVITQDKIESIYADGNDEDESFNLVDRELKFLERMIMKRNIKQETMYDLMLKVANGKVKQVQRRLLNILYKTNKDTLLSVFKNATKCNDEVA